MSPRRPTSASRDLLLIALGVVVGCTEVDIYAVTAAPSTEADVGVEPVAIEPAAMATAEEPSVSPSSQQSTPDVELEPSDMNPLPGEPIPASCPPSAVLPAGDTRLTVEVGMGTRSYVLHVPPAYDGSRPVPLIVDFHGMGTTGMNQLSNSSYPPVTDPEGVIMAFPDGLAGPLGQAWNIGSCCVADADDLTFSRLLVQQIQETACIDADRVYAVGVLTGGGMVHHLACEAADVFAAAAPAAFDLLAETADTCEPARPIAVLTFRGTAATRVPYEGGPSSLVPGMPITFLGAQGTLERWAQINGCINPPVTEDENGCAAYSGCAGDVTVSLCTDHGGREQPGNAALAWPILKGYTR